MKLGTRVPSCQKQRQVMRCCWCSVRQNFMQMHNACLCQLTTQAGLASELLCLNQGCMHQWIGPWLRSMHLPAGRPKAQHTPRLSGLSANLWPEAVHDCLEECFVFSDNRFITLGRACVQSVVPPVVAKCNGWEQVTRLLGEQLHRARQRQRWKWRPALGHLRQILAIFFLNAPEVLVPIHILQTVEQHSRICAPHVHVLMCIPECTVQNQRAGKAQVEHVWLPARQTTSCGMKPYLDSVLYVVHAAFGVVIHQLGELSMNNYRVQWVMCALLEPKHLLFKQGKVALHAKNRWMADVTVCGARSSTRQKML